MGATTMGSGGGKGAWGPPSSGGGSYVGDNHHLASAPTRSTDDGLGLGLGIDLMTGSPAISLSNSSIGPCLDLRNGEIGIGLKL